MGLRRWFFDLLNRGEAPAVDPEALVEVAVVQLHDGPRLVAELQRQGLEATGIEAFNIATDTRSLMRIMVRHADLATASAIAEAFR
jgi:hypothetical protein